MDNPGGLVKEMPEPLIVAVETSSRTGSVALAMGPQLLEEARFSAPMQHSAEIFPAIALLLMRHGRHPADVHQVHIATGPGSFTGLRIAVTIAKAMHLAKAVRIVTVGSLDVLAANLAEPAEDLITSGGDGPHLTTPDRIAALFDAKRGQFYAAVYERSTEAEDPVACEAGYRIPAPNGGTWRKVVPDRLMTAAEIIQSSNGAERFAVLGDGLLHHRDKFKADGIHILAEAYWGPRATNVHRLGYQKAGAGRFADPSALTPLYLRGPQVTLKARS